MSVGNNYQNQSFDLVVEACPLQTDTYLLCCHIGPNLVKIYAIQRIYLIVEKSLGLKNITSISTLISLLNVNENTK